MIENKKLRNVIFWLISQEIIETQEEFAEKLGHNPAYISQLVTGKKPISEKFVKTLTEKFENINPNYFMEDKQNIQNFENVSGGIGGIQGDKNHITQNNNYAEFSEMNKNYQLIIKTYQIQVDRLVSVIDKLVDKYGK